MRQIAPADVIWSYAGVRALYDDGAAEAKDVTRDYRLELDPRRAPKLLSVFGGKITTARALALEALDRLGVGGLKFTATSPLPGGNVDRRLQRPPRPRSPPGCPRRCSPASPAPTAPASTRLLGDAAALADLGRHFGAGLYEAEVRYLIDVEFARTAEDIIWRRTKLGLEMTKAEQRASPTG